MPARLSIYLADGPQQIVWLEEGQETLIGRRETCAVCIDDERVSRRHAAVGSGPLGWKLRDLGSKNGTSVEGRQVQETLLDSAAWISLGGLLVRFEALSESQRQADALGRLERYRTSAELQRDLDPAVGVPELLRRLLGAVSRLGGAERGFVLLAAEGGELEVVATAGLTVEELRQVPFSGSTGAVERALTTGAAVVLADATVDPQLAGRASIEDYGIRTVLCLPLHDGDHQIGALYADSSQPTAPLTDLDVEILEGLARHAALAISVARLDAESRGVLASLAGGERRPRTRLTWGELLERSRCPQEAGA